MEQGRTIVRILGETRPRGGLCARLGLSVQYASDIARRRRVLGSTAMLARISGRLGLSNDEIGASVREMFPEHFEPSEGGEAPPETGSMLSDAAVSTHDQAAAHESASPTRGAA